MLNTRKYLKLLSGDQPSAGQVLKPQGPFPVFSRLISTKNGYRRFPGFAHKIPRPKDMDAVTNHSPIQCQI